MKQINAVKLWSINEKKIYFFYFAKSLDGYDKPKLSLNLAKAKCA